MAAPANIVNAAAVNASLDVEVLKNFRGQYDRLAEILGIFSPEVVAAGTAIYQTKFNGTLNNTASGTGYVEGDEVALSKFGVDKVAIDPIQLVPYRKMTTAQAILKSGHVRAVMGTDAKMISTVRAGVVSDFFGLLANGTTTANGKGLQAALANGVAKLGDVLENANDAASRVVTFMNRQDAADYLGTATITNQDVFGMTYLENFLGATNVFLTSKVPAGTIYTTAAENIHAYAIDFSGLGEAGMPYAIDESGIIGVSHRPAYDHVSVETNILRGVRFVPEMKDYIVKTTIQKVTA